jgi:hypothetical protein
MESLKKHGDPLEEEIRPDPAGAIDEVASNQPGSKGRRKDEEPEIVRSVSQTPNPNQPDDDLTTPAETDLSKRRSNM